MTVSTVMVVAGKERAAEKPLKGTEAHKVSLNGSRCLPAELVAQIHLDFRVSCSPHVNMHLLVFRPSPLHLSLSLFLPLKDCCSLPDIDLISYPSSGWSSSRSLSFPSFWHVQPFVPRAQKSALFRRLQGSSGRKWMA